MTISKFGNRFREMFRMDDEYGIDDIPVARMEMAIIIGLSVCVLGVIALLVSLPWLLS